MVGQWQVTDLRNELWYEREVNAMLRALLSEALSQRDPEHGAQQARLLIDELHRALQECPERCPACGGKTVPTQQRCFLCDWRIPRRQD